MSFTNKDVLSKISEVYNEIFEHDGFGEMTVAVKILKRGQKEVIIHCGKQYRFVIDYPSKNSYEVVTYEKALSEQS